MSSWSFFSLLDSSAVSRPLLASAGTNLMFSFSETLKPVTDTVLYQDVWREEVRKDLPAVNSVPASSAVARKSSKELCSVTDCKFRRPQSYPSFSSLVWSWFGGGGDDDMLYQIAVTFILETITKYVYIIIH